MTVTIREVEGSAGEYFAYTKSVCGKATYLAYFRDDIFGAVVLVNFVEMLRAQFAAKSVETPGELHSAQEPDSAGSAAKLGRHGVGGGKVAATDYP